MSQNKHTPGPWWSPDGKTIKQDYRQLTEAGGCIIAGVMGGSSSGPFFIEDDAEVSANTRLIAAAPELLEVLEKLLMAYQDPGNTGSTYDETVEAAQAVIAKARGQQP